MENQEIRQSVRQHYARAAKGDTTGGCGCGPSCCGGESAETESLSLKMGYDKAEIEVLPEGADLGLGCGNPGAIAKLKPGEVVLDLGSGGGIDCFIAARKVGEHGRVIGIDMTPEMIYKARGNATRVGLANVEFRLGEIEHLPVESSIADVIISNCVINLSPDKPAVFREAYRVLKPGGRLAISDVVATQPVPDSIRGNAGLWSACAAGAMEAGELRQLLGQIGFHDIKVEPHTESRELVKEWTAQADISDYFLSADIEAVKG